MLGTSVRSIVIYDSANGPALDFNTWFQNWNCQIYLSRQMLALAVRTMSM